MGPARVVWRLGRKIYCFARGEGANQIDLNGEAYVQKRVLGSAGPGEKIVVFDVGANVGEWTQALIQQIESDRGQDLQVWAFEPSPETHALLSKRNGDRDEITCIPAALSNTEGSGQLMMASATGGTNTLVYDNELEYGAFGMVDVEKRTATSFCQLHKIDHIHLFKCDTEGHDLSVIQGASSLLAQERIDILQFEYNHRWVYARAFLKDVFEMLADSPYHIAIIRPTRIELFPEWHPELDRFFEANYLIVHQSALGWFDVLEGQFDVSNTYA